MERMLSVKQAAALFPSRPSDRSVRSWALDGRKNKRTRSQVYLRHVLSGGTIVIPESAIEEFLIKCNEGRPVS